MSAKPSPVFPTMLRWRGRGTAGAHSRHATMAQFALRWILMEEAVSVVIPGARTATGDRKRGRSALPLIRPT